MSRDELVAVLEVERFAPAPPRPAEPAPTDEQAARNRAQLEAALRGAP